MEHVKTKEIMIERFDSPIFTVDRENLSFFFFFIQYFQFFLIFCMVDTIKEIKSLHM